jgi:hypothetical protein
MSHQSLSFFGILGAVALAIGCAGLLGIEDAECDPSYDAECALPGAGGGSAFGAMQTAPSLLPGNGGGGGGGVPAAVASAGAGGSAAAPAAGRGGAGGGSAGGAGAIAGAAGGASMGEVDPVVARASALCLEYCDTIMASCTGMNAQYASPNACLLVCELLEPGTPGSTSGNNVNCRLGRAELAASTGEGANYCYTAGPGGGNVCGQDCDSYCLLMTSKCDELGTFNQCTTACASVPDLSQPPTVQFYNTSIQSGDSLQCRLFHASASTLDPVLHCPHAAGNAPCN